MKIHLSNDVCKSCLSSYHAMLNSTVKIHRKIFFWLSGIFQFFREWNMSEKKKRKEIDNEPVRSVSLQRSKDWSWTVIKGLYNLDPLSSLCFMTFFISGTQSQGYLWGEPPPHFSRGKLFLFEYKAHAVSRVPVILHLIQVEIFREISDWECCKCNVRAFRFLNFLGEDSHRPPPPPKKLASPARLFKGSYHLKLRSAVPANDSLWVFPTKSKSWRSPSLWLLKLAISGTPH